MIQNIMLLVPAAPGAALPEAGAEEA